MRDAALQQERAGNFEEATNIFAAACLAHPADIALLNSAGAFHARRQEHLPAVGYFDRALKLNAQYGEAVVNRAISLAALRRRDDAMAGLRDAQIKLSNDPRYWSTRASIERDCNDLAAAAASYDRCLLLNATHQRALHGRARVALERAEQDTVARYRTALAATPDDGELWLGFAQALEADGDHATAMSIGAQMAGRAPGWVAAQELLAEQRWASGERSSFCDHYQHAVEKAANAPELFRSWTRMLAGVDQFDQAAQVAAIARTRFPEERIFALLEAVHAGEAGDDARAERIFGTLSMTGTDRMVHEARHRLRIGQPENAERLLAAVIEAQPDHVGAWALRDLAWRLLNDTRHDWLHGQAGLIASIPLDVDPQTLGEIVALLDQLHDRSSWPVGQSVRDGTQTRGGLFDRAETEISQLKRCVDSVVTRYRAGLPSPQPQHPLLRQRDSDMHIAGSWSVRLSGGGRHVAHIHPHGLLSSAAHLVVPPDLGGSDDGALELGRSPPDLRLDLQPIATIAPRAGYCVLFPSTLYHGTRRFSNGRRLTVAFDVTAS